MLYWYSVSLYKREICEVKNETERKNRSIIYGGNGNTADSYQCIIFYDNKDEIFYGWR